MEMEEGFLSSPDSNWVFEWVNGEEEPVTTLGNVEIIMNR